MTPSYWKKACAELSASDPVMASIMAAYPGELLQTRGDAFFTLARSIIGQQVSVKAADSIWNRYEAAVNEVNPRAQLALDEETLRNCGLSRQKIRYLGEIARYFVENDADEAFFAQMSDDEALKSLTSIVGVGRWTAEMFLMFHLMRPNIFPVDDIGVQNAIEKHYAGELPEMKDLSKKQKYQIYTSIAERWQPWRSVAVWYLWRSLDPVPVAY